LLLLEEIIGRRGLLLRMAGEVIVCGESTLVVAALGDGGMCG
jgi:hypothetical protein